MADRIFTFPERAEEARRNYKRLNLERNPFPLQGLASRETPFVPYPKRVIQAINKFVADAIGSRGYHGLPIIGDYGSGKTRLFFALDKEISERIVGCSAVYIDEPPADIHLFYEKILDKTDLDSILKGLSLRFGKDIESIMSKHLERVPSLLGEEKYFLKDKGIRLVKEISSFLSKELGLTKSKDTTLAYAILLLDYFVSNIVSAGKKMRMYFGDVKTAHKWLRAAEGEEIAAALTKGNWMVYHDAWKNARKLVTAEVKARVRRPGLAELEAKT